MTIFPILGQEKLRQDSKEFESAPFMGRAAVVTLGCAKNQVDSEVMLGALASNGYELVDNVEEAEVAIVNTCGFLESAINESIDCILDIAPLKSEGRLRKLIVTGCLVERYREELIKELPEVDAFIDTHELLQVSEVAGQASTQPLLSPILRDASRPYFLYDDTLPRVLSTPSHTAYVKVSEGCNRPCTFCIIPKIRGSLRSRTISSILSETQELAARGTQEINLIAQDLTAFGADSGGGGLVQLLQALDDQQLIKWIRLLYAYPVGTTPELLEAIRSLPSVCNYLDIPLQHASEAVLKRMKRPLGKLSPRKLVEYIRQDFPEIALRTTFIVGFPGETRSDVDTLEDLILEGHFENVGIFEYSPEQGTPAFDLEEQVSPEEKQERRERLMLAQQSIVAKRSDERIGKVFDVLIEGVHDESDMLLTARTAFQAPEVDCSVIVNDIEGAEEDIKLGDYIGKIHRARITEVAGYDLIGQLVGRI